MIDEELTSLIARPRRWQRAQRWPGALILAAGVWGLAFLQVEALLFVVVGFWGTAEFWREARVTGDRLIAQGRVSRRTLRLAAIRQVWLAPGRDVWVQPVEGKTLVLNMAEVRTDAPGDAVAVCERIRELAAAAGADLEPPPEAWIKPPPPATVVFGW